jgi:hypothetical protein
LTPSYQVLHERVLEEISLRGVEPLTPSILAASRGFNPIFDTLQHGIGQHGTLPDAALLVKESNGCHRNTEKRKSALL